MEFPHCIRCYKSTLETVIPNRYVAKKQTGGLLKSHTSTEVRAFVTDHPARSKGLPQGQ